MRNRRNAIHDEFIKANMMDVDNAIIKIVKPRCIGVNIKVVSLLAVINREYMNRNIL